MTRKAFLKRCGIAHRPHMLEQWIAKGIITPLKDESDNRIYTEHDYQKLRIEGLVK